MLIVISLRECGILIISSYPVTPWKYHRALRLMCIKAAYLVWLSPDQSAWIWKTWPLLVKLLIFDWLLLNCSSWCIRQLNVFTSALWCFRRQRTLQSLQRRLKTSPRRTQSGREWWSSPRARMTQLQLSVGLSFSAFCLLICTAIQSESTSLLLAPFGHLYPSLKPHISKLHDIALNRC